MPNQVYGIQTYQQSRRRLRQECAAGPARPSLGGDALACDGLWKERSTRRHFRRRRLGFSKDASKTGRTVIELHHVFDLRRRIIEGNSSLQHAPVHSPPRRRHWQHATQHCRVTIQMIAVHRNQCGKYGTKCNLLRFLQTRLAEPAFPSEMRARRCRQLTHVGM